MEREFRIRQQFMGDIHTYLFVMILGIWLTINFVLKVNRSREQCQAIIEGRAPPVQADEPPKSAQQKKDD